MKVSDAVGTFAMVFILPEDINLTSGSPQYHRNFLDIYLCQYSRSYLSDLIEYQRILKQRNSLLKRILEGEKGSGDLELDVWDKSLVSSALRIMAARRRFVDELGSAVNDIVGELSGSKESVKVAYRPKIEIENFEDLESALDFFVKARDKDKRYGSTVLGPHRDIIEIKLNGRPLRLYGSLGQKKTVMIAMKLAALDVISSHLGERAVLALDEAFAEFDSTRTGALLDLLSGRGQVFLASADDKGVSKVYDDMRIFNVENGVVTER